MKKTVLLAFLALTTFFTSCEREYILPVSLMPVTYVYNGYVTVTNTGNSYATATIANTPLVSGKNKIHVFPKEMKIRSYYLTSDAQGNMSFEYMLAKSYDIPAGYEGTQIGSLLISNAEGSAFIEVPVVYTK